MAENFRCAEELKPLQYYSLQLEDIGEPVEDVIGTLQAKIKQNLQVAAVSAAEFFDKDVHDAIVQEARKAGVTDLVILDRDFVVEAIKRHLVHGRWKEHYFSHRVDTYGNPDIGMECSVCGFRWYSKHDTKIYFRYCPNCGAKMDGGTST